MSTVLLACLLVSYYCVVGLDCEVHPTSRESLPVLQYHSHSTLYISHTFTYTHTTATSLSKKTSLLKRTVSMLCALTWVAWFLGRPPTTSSCVPATDRSTLRTDTSCADRLPCPWLWHTATWTKRARFSFRPGPKRISVPEKKDGGIKYER